MKLEEVLTMGGFSAMTGPGTFTANQVVQPRTVQADEPEQSGEEYEKLKDQQPEQEKVNIDRYNRKKAKQLRYYYDKDKNSETVAKKINDAIFKLKKDRSIKMAKDYTQFAPTIMKGVDG